MILDANDAMLRQSGYRLHEVLGRSPRLFQGPETCASERSRFREAISAWQPVVVELLNDHRDRTGVNLAGLTMEITESVLLRLKARAVMELTRLRQAGVTIALDDFGTGYSSLAWLSRIPIDEVKIDRSSITPMVQVSRTRLLVQGFVRMFQELGLRLVAEGIETIDQRDALLAMGWGIGQGWLFGRPGPPEALLGEALRPAGNGGLGASPDRPGVASFRPSASEG